ncbi:MAG: hypothetical protein JXQ75_00510 [Phycisphaerae bacterium]|nr:hypothetical protein [Phycisphaerae bacterium]
MDDAFGRDNRGTFDPDAMRGAWETLRAELLPKWIAAHPGTRPYAWWVFDAPERRRRTDGRPHPFDNIERNTKVNDWRQKYTDVADREAYKLWFGKPGCLMVLDDFHAVYEAEAEYLDRHGLPTEDERAALVVHCVAE